MSKLFLFILIAFTLSEILKGNNGLCAPAPQKKKIEKNKGKSAGKIKKTQEDKQLQDTEDEDEISDENETQPGELQQEKLEEQEITDEKESEEEKEVTAKNEESPPPAKQGGLTLQQCLMLSRKNHPAIIAAQHKLRALKKQLDEAHWSPFFNIGMTTMLAPMSRMEGNAVYSPQGEFDISTDMGVWLRLQLQAGIPIFTFGKIKSYWKMAEEAVSIGKSELKKQTNEIEFEVRRAYFTLLFARQIKEVLSEGKDYLKEAQEKIEKDLESEEGEATMSDLLKVKAYSAQLQSQYLQIENVENTAMAGLRFLTGKNDLQINENSIQTEEGSLNSLNHYLNKAKKNRPEILMLEAAVNVSNANLKLAKSNYLPDFMLVGSYTFAYANKVEDQHTPFASDPYNTNSGGVALMMRYSFDFVPNYFRTDRAKASLLQMISQSKAATGAFMMEVENAYNQALSLQKRVEELKKGKKAAKGWIVATHQNYNAGLAELKDFTDALVTYFTITSEYYKAIYEYNIALSSLRLVTGSEEIF